jgi:hypothetical protein
MSLELRAVSYQLGSALREGKGHGDRSADLRYPPISHGVEPEQNHHDDDPDDRNGEPGNGVATIGPRRDGLVGAAVVAEATATVPTAAWSHATRGRPWPPNHVWCRDGGRAREENIVQSKALTRC